MSRNTDHPVADVTQRYQMASCAAKRVWMALMAYHRGGLRLSELAEISGDDEATVRDILADLRATDRAIEQRGSHYIPTTAPTPEENAFFHEELVQHLIASGQDRRALDLLYRTALLHQQLGDEPGRADDLGNIGALLLRGGHFDKAWSVFQEALEVHDAQGHLPGQARDWANLGVTAAHMGQLAEAISCLQKALEFFERMGDPEMVRRTLENLDELRAIPMDDTSP